MKQVKSKSLNMLLIATLLLSFIIPSTTFAYTTDGNPENPKLTIHKLEQDPNGNGVDEGTPLPGVEFTLTQTHQYNPETDEWTEVNGDPFTRITNDSGQIVIEGMELGRYKVQETDGPLHVNLNTEEYFVDIPMTSADGNTLNYDVHIYPKNETIRGAVELHKLDGEQADETGLAGVVFDLYTADDELVAGGLVTDGDGYIRVDGLEYGDYYFIETEAPEDYVMFGDKKHFSITESGTLAEDGTRTGTVVEIEITNYVAPAIEKTVEGSTETYETNRETEYEYNLTIALPKDIAQYKKFIVTDVLDDRISYAGSWNVEGISEDILTFTQDGQTLTWAVNNFGALDGVESFTINFTAKINGDVDLEAIEVEGIPNTGKINFTNESDQDGEKETPPVYVKPTSGALKIIKQDGDTEEKLAGAEFELRDLEGNVIKSGTTNDAGEISWEDLDYGDYQLVETKAPEGYRLLTSPIDVKINGDENEVTLTVNNTKTGWELPTTGGIGSVLFTLIGLLLMGTAVVLYINRRKQEQTA